MLKYSHPTLALVLDYWPITIFTPAILVLIATLALITRWWDKRDQAARGTRGRRSGRGCGRDLGTGRRKPRAGPRPDQPLGGDHGARAAS